MKKLFNILPFLLIITGCKYFNQTHHVTLDSTEFITNTYKNKSNIITDEERQEITNKGCSPVYGEILIPSLKTLLDDLNIKPTDVFYDLGSGTGKVTIQAYLDYPFKKAVGIELAPTRCNHSIDAKKELAAQNALDKNLAY
jgi:tRNA G46 methylase TrmB